MGGADAALGRLQKDHDAGKYELVAFIAHYLVFADPTNMKAREMEANALEQLGYQVESGTAQNAYLTGAQELRSTDPINERSGISEDIMAAISMSKLLDYISVRVNGQKADGEDYKMNLVLSDIGDKALIQVKNDALVYWVDKSSPDAAVTVTMPRKTLEGLALDPSTTPEDVTTTGDSEVFDRFVGILDVFNPGFNIVTP